MARPGSCHWTCFLIYVGELKSPLCSYGSSSGNRGSLSSPPHRGWSFSMNLKQSVKPLPNCCPQIKALSWARSQTVVKINQRFVNHLKNRAVYGLLYNNSGWRRALSERARRHLHPLAGGASGALPLAQRPVFFHALLHLGQAAPGICAHQRASLSPGRRRRMTSGTGIRLGELLHMYFIGIFCSSWPANIPTVLHWGVNSLKISRITKEDFPCLFFFSL